MQMKEPKKYSETSPKLELRDYQIRAIRFSIDNPASFQMLDMGLGKTAIALKVIQRLRIPAIIFAPLRVATIVWPTEIELWTPELSYTVLHGPKKDMLFHKEADLYIISYSSIAWYFNKVMTTYKDLRYYALILDESSMIKNPKTKRFKMIRNLSTIVSSYKMLLSATPSPNGLHELWSQLCVLDGGNRLGTSYYQFMDEFFEPVAPNSYTLKLKTFGDIQIYNLIDDITFRLDAEDYLELPEIIYNRIDLKLPPKLKYEYAKLERDFCLELNGSSVEAFTTASKSLKLRQFLQGAVYTKNSQYTVIHNLKVKALADLIDCDPGKAILCAIQFKFELDMIRKELGNVPVIAGETSAKESNRLVRLWNAGQLPLLLCHPASLSHGMNLQAGGNIVLWYGLTWSLEQYHQLNGRLHRHGQKEAVIVHHLIFPGTIEEEVQKVLKNKDATQSKLLDHLKEVTKV